MSSDGGTLPLLGLAMGEVAALAKSAGGLEVVLGYLGVVVAPASRSTATASASAIKLRPLAGPLLLSSSGPFPLSSSAPCLSPRFVLDWCLASSRAWFYLAHPRSIRPFGLEDPELVLLICGVLDLFGSARPRCRSFRNRV